MKPYDDEAELTAYVWNHYTHLFTPLESKARWAVFADAKARVGSKQLPEDIWKQQKLAEDRALMEALADGIESFRRRTAKRVLSEHASDVLVNRCAKCDRVVRTPNAQQCLWCGHDWHPRPTNAAAIQCESPPQPETLDYRSPSTPVPRRPILRLIVLSTALVLLIISIVWCIATWSSPGRFIFLPGGDVGLGFRSHAGWLEWVEYAPWMAEPDNVRWCVPWAGVFLIEAFVVLLSIYQPRRAAERPLAE